MTQVIFAYYPYIQVVCPQDIFFRKVTLYINIGFLDGLYDFNAVFSDWHLIKYFP